MRSILDTYKHRSQESNPEEYVNNPKGHVTVNVEEYPDQKTLFAASPPCYQSYSIIRNECMIPLFSLANKHSTIYQYLQNNTGIIITNHA